MKKLRLGALGVGPRCRNLITLYAKHPEVEITGLCDLYDKNLERALGKDHLNDPNIPVFKDFQKMLAECPMDALFIAMPPTVQAEFACIAMEHGIHVMTEVPCTYSIADCWRLVDTVEKTGMHYMLAEQLRYGYLFRQWRKMHADGAFGKMLYVEGQYTHYEKWGYYTNSQDGGIVTNLEDFQPSYSEKSSPPDRYKGSRAGDFTTTWRFDTFSHPIYYLPHELSPILSVLNDRVTEVICVGSEKGVNAMEVPMPHNPENRDVEVALMRTEKDAILRMMVGFSTPCGAGHWYHFKGSKSSAESSRNSYNDFDISSPLSWTVERGWENRRDWTLFDNDADELTKNSGHGGVDWYPIRNFVDLILHGGPNTMDVYRAVETAAPAILAAESCDRGGEKILIPDFRAKYGRTIGKAYRLE